MKKSAVNSAYLHFCSVAITVTTAELHTLFFSCGCNILLFCCCQAYYDVLADATVSEGFLGMFYFNATSELRARETVKMPKECREMSSLLWCINCHIIYRQSYIRKSSFRSWREEKHLLVFVRMFSSLLPLWWLYGLALLVSFLLAFLEVVDLALNLESSFCNALKVVIQIRVECLSLELNAPYFH